MSDARARILARMSQGLGRPCPDTVARVQREDAPMARQVVHHVADFIARAHALQSTTDRVADMAAVPAAVARYLRTAHLPLQGVMWPQFADLDWVAQGLALEMRAPQSDDRTGVTGCFCAIAETGTLLLHSGVGLSAAASLLPETHVAVVPVARIVTRMEQAFALLRSEVGSVPRALNFISGPSRTADIEQTIVIGAHGPRRVHLIVVDG
ncbi:MAG: lactate utilization protein C [Pseudomonadota bacterium]|nr:lactate utilization protein C [Pseudomonadota bacterium]